MITETLRKPKLVEVTTEPTTVNRVLATRNETASPSQKAQEVYSIRGLQGTADQLLASPKRALFALLTAQSVVFDHLAETRMLDDAEVRNKTADTMAHDRQRIFYGLHRTQPPEVSSDTISHETARSEAVGLLARAATIYSAKIEAEEQLLAGINYN